MLNDLKERKYSISDLSKLSGIKAHTIRIWEQRYHLLTPKRTDTNIRYYDDVQLKKLLNVSTLVNGGHKISSVGKLSDKEIEGKALILAESGSKPDLYEESVINQLASSGLSYNLSEFEHAFNSAIKRFGFFDTYLKIIYPLLLKIGSMWNKSELIPAQEHFISNLIKQKFFSAIDSLPVPAENAESWVLFLPQGEFHNLGLLLSSYIIRQAGHKSIYLGQDLPYKNVVSAVNQTGAGNILFFITSRIRRSGVQSYLSKISHDFPDKKIYVSGTDQAIVEAQALGLKNIIIIKSPHELQAIL